MELKYYIKKLKEKKKNSALTKWKITKLFFPFLILTQSCFNETERSPKKTRHIRNIVDPGKSYKIKRCMEAIWQCFIIKIGLTKSDMPNLIRKKRKIRRSPSYSRVPPPQKKKKKNQLCLFVWETDSWVMIFPTSIIIYVP